jgi:putative ABC transport system substrate-binding protein
MRRRDFVTGPGATVAWPLSARAQQQALPVIGFLNSGSPDSQENGMRALLREAGFVDWRNVAIEYHWVMATMLVYPDWRSTSCAAGWL